MSEPIKLYIKETVVSGAENEFKLDLIEHDNNTLYEESNGPTVELGEGSYEFEIKIYLDDELVHTVVVSQNESGDTMKPGDLPGGRSLSLPTSGQEMTNKSDPPPQNESGDTMKPGDLPGSKKLF